MVLRTFGAIDNEALTVVSAPGNSNQNPGDPIINNSNSPNGTIYEFGGGFPTRIIELDDTGGNPDVFEDGNPGGHTITDGKGLVADGTGVESESILRLRELDVNGNPTGPVINVSVFSQNGNFSDIWGFSPSAPLTPGVQYVKVGGTNNGRSEYEDFIPCFVAGTHVRVAGGATKPVENLASGDLLWTRDHGEVAVALVATAVVSGHGPLAPIRFEAGAIGNDRALEVSPQHRMLIASPQVELLTGASEVLIPAHRLLGLPGVSRAPRDAVSYVHLIFDRHMIVEAAGVLSESFYPGAQAMRGVEDAVRDELSAIFPDLATNPPAFAAPVISGREADVLVGEMAAAA